MNIAFDKFHGAGNDFIMIDGRNSNPKIYTESIVKALCNRHFGIGADGMILLLNSHEYDFRMAYYNADGREGTMCGNGGRCITAFAKKLGIINYNTEFEGIDGKHSAQVQEDNTCRLKMIDVDKVEILEDGYLLETGSRHFVVFRKNISDLDVYREGKMLRMQKRFAPDGCNVNFINILNDNEIEMRTFERGVEDETLACGTGSVASAITAFLSSSTDKTSYIINAPGGKLKVEFKTDNKKSFYNIWLSGPAEFVFSGNIEV